MIYKNDQDSIRSYFEDSSNLKGGHAELVVIPETIDELSAFIGKANIDKMPVTVSGGGTATTGSRIPFGGAVISLERFNNILGLSRSSMSVMLQTGVSVDELKKSAEAEGLFYASHPTEKNASIGGTVATNASGSRSFKYGPTRDYVKRLKMVMANGAILDLRRGDVFLSRANSVIPLGDGRSIVVPMPDYIMPGSKSASGYYARDGMDAIDLFIGQEGTLSVIVEVELSLVNKPRNILSSFIFFKQEDDAWRFAIEARDLSKNNRITASGGIDALSIEYFDDNALSLLRPNNTNIPESAKAAIFFEQDAATKAEEDYLLNKWMDLIAKYELSVDGTWVAMTESEAHRFTDIRYAVPETVNDIIRRNGFRKFSTDISVPDNKASDMMKYYSDVFRRRAIDHLIFGHIGENHLHVNIIPKNEAEAAVASELIMIFIKKGVEMGGAVSAEHGIGKLKHKYLEIMYGKTGVSDMVRIKQAVDPNCILGAGNIFPRELLNY